MKKLLLSFVVLPAVLATAQVGVNTDQPSGSFDVAYIKGAEGTKWGPATPQGVNFPNVSTAQRSQFENVKKGMMIYNTDKQCLEMYLGDESGSHQWECIPNVGSESSQRVSVSPAGFDGQFIGGVPLKGASVSFKITNNGFSPIDVDFSDAVTVENKEANITVTDSDNSSVSLKGGGSQTLKYQLSGTPQAGTLTARFNGSRLSADQQTTVGKGGANLQNQEHYIVSFAHGSTTIQGQINNGNNQVRIKIPYTNGKGSYDAVSITQDAAPGQGGATKPITLSIPAGNFGARGELTATLSVDGSYQVKQMGPGKDYDIVTYNININGSTSKVVIKGIGGIPDRMFGKMTNGQLRHQFIYLPVTVTGAGGYNRTWLNYNLGAEFAKVGENFKPQQQLFGQAAHDEAKTHGSLYQWQRASDGHELRNVQTTTQKATSWTNTSPSAGKFITGEANWVRNGGNATGSELKLWRAGREGINNPCPSGYHVPTVEEWQQLLNAVGSQMYTQTKLPNLAAAGYHYYYNGSLSESGSYGYYWSSSAFDSNGAHYMYFSSGYSGTNGGYGRAYGSSVRCLKD